MALPNLNITPIPDTDPDAVPSLWNTRYAEMDENFAYLETSVLNSVGDAHSSDEAIKLAWWMQNTKTQIEQWTPSWSLHDPLSVAVAAEGIIGGDNSADVASTSDFVVGREYVVFDGVNAESFVVSAVLTGTRLTADANFTHSYTTGAMVVGCQWDFSPSLAHAENGEICYFLPLNVGDDSGDKTVIVRREDNDCGLRLYFKDANHIAWTEVVAGESAEFETGVIDVRYTVPGQGLITLKFVCEAEGTASDMDVYLIGVLNLSIAHNVVQEDTTFYVSSTGNDATGNGSAASPWLTINKVFDSLADKRINEGVTVTIELDDGTYSYTEHILANHADGDKIKITGKNVYAKTISAIVNNTGTEATPAGAGNTIQAVLTLNNVDNIEVDDYAIIRNLHAVVDDSAVYDHISADMIYQKGIKDLRDRGTMLHLNGCFKVTDVNSGSSQITIATTFYPSVSYGAFKDDFNQTIGSYEGELTVIKSILSFTDVAGIIASSGHTLGNYVIPGIDKVAVVGNDGSNSDNLYWLAGVGIGAIERSQMFLGENVGVTDWWIGIGATHTSNVLAEKACVSGCWKAGLYASFSSAIMAYNAYVTGCESGAYAHDASAIHMDSSGVGCCSFGLRTCYDSHIMQSNGVIENCVFGARAHFNASMALPYNRTYNCSNGHSAEHEGHIYGTDSILHTCTLGAKASFGGLVKADSTTFTACTTDSSPAVNTEGNTMGFVEHSAP